MKKNFLYALKNRTQVQDKLMVLKKIRIKFEDSKAASKEGYRN